MGIRGQAEVAGKAGGMAHRPDLVPSENTRVRVGLRSLSPSESCIVREGTVLTKERESTEAKNTCSACIYK